MNMNKGLWMWLWVFLSLVIGLGIGGLFVNGTFLSVPLLKYLPSVVHTVVGWVIIVLSVLKAGGEFI